MNEETKNVMISIHSRQEFEEGTPDSVELTTTGLLSRTENGYCITYQESALTGMEGTSTSLQISPRRVIITRTGQLNSQMVFEKDVRHLSLYTTPMGRLEVGVATRRLYSTINDQGGELEVDYAIDIDHQLTGKNFFSLTVREAEITQ
jgi:uncharacterized beta-barrel protein YwiB (DUF1934 family)